MPLCINMMRLAVAGSFFAPANTITLEASEPSSSFVRRETTQPEIQGQNEVRFGPKGEMSLSQERAAPALETSDADILRKAFPSGEDSCNHVWFEGDEFTSSTNCESTLQGTRIDNGAMCLYAAETRNVTAVASKQSTSVFLIPDTQFNDHPRGCFWQACTEDPVKGCYRFNAIVEETTSLPLASDTSTAGIARRAGWGKPVCKRPKYDTAPADQNGGCPADYVVIENEYHCQAAAHCMGHCTGNEFRPDVKNQSKYDDYPLGCYIENLPGGINQTAIQQYVPDEGDDPQLLQDDSSTLVQKKQKRSKPDSLGASAEDSITTHATLELHQCVYYNQRVVNRMPARPKGTTICFLSQP